MIQRSDLDLTPELIEELAALACRGLAGPPIKLKLESLPVVPGGFLSGSIPRRRVPSDE